MSAQRQSVERMSRLGGPTLLLGLLLIGSVGCPTVRAEILPTKGTFRGIYQVNRAGVGRFRFFIVSKSLVAKLQPHAGKYVEIEVVQGRQPVNPGPAIIDQVGKVTALPLPRLKVTMRFVPSGVSPGHIDVVYEFSNTGRGALTLVANDVKIGVRRYTLPATADARDLLLQTGYRRRQLSFAGTLRQPWNFVSPMSHGVHTHYYTGTIRLEPGESVPFVLAGVNLPPGTYEVAAAALDRSQPVKPVPVMAARDLDIPRRAESAPVRRLNAEAAARRERDWLVVTGKLLPATDQKTSVFTIPSDREHFLPGSIQAFGADGKPLDARLQWSRPDGVWRRTELTNEGLPFRFKLRPADRFSQTPITRIEMATVTDEGLERWVLVDNISPAPPRPVPAWGPVVKGCRLRVQPAAESFEPGEAIKFSYQAESDGAAADIVWVDRGNGPTHVVTTIDGKPVRIGSTSLADGHVYRFPFQGTITLTRAAGLAPGKHKLKFSVKSDGGVYKNLTGRKFRKLDATLISNEVEFEIKRP